MDKKPGWTYSFCNSLEQNIAINDTTDVLYTEDKIRYSPEETALLRTINFQIPKSVHVIKKIFNGTIVSL